MNSSSAVRHPPPMIAPFHLPEEPQVSRMTEFAPLPFKILIWLGGIMIVGGLISIWHFMKNRAKE
jgi:hypothetical protein